MDSAICLLNNWGQKNNPSETDKSSRYKSGVQANLIRLSALTEMIYPSQTDNSSLGI